MKKGHRPDYIFITCVALLVIFGLAALSSASSDLGKIKFNDTFYYLKHQIFYGLSVGIAGFLIALNIHYKHLKRFSPYLLAANIVLLILVFTPLGLTHRGASRWLDFGPLSIQPAEFLKISLMLYLAAWLSNRKANRQSSFFEGLLPFLVVAGIIAGLILAQPATTILAIIMGAALIVYFLGGAKISHIVIIGCLGIIMLFSVIYFTSYRYERIMAYLSGSGNTQTIGYQLNQSLIAIGSGKLFGVGFGESTTKYKYLPEPIGDSIFAVIAEELGFIGALLLIILFIILFTRGFLIAKKSHDQFAKLMAMGIISVVAIQTFVHIAAISGLMPLTGVSLPFISYGGTSLAVFLTMMGIIGNISKYT